MSRHKDYIEGIPSESDLRSVASFGSSGLSRNLYYGGGDAGAAIAAALYVASNVYSWSEARQMPQRQADANKKVLELQKKHYDAIAKEKRDILRAAIGDWLSETTSLVEGAEFDEAYPEVPRFAEYVPVDPCCEQSATIECNMEKVARADEFYKYVNRKHEENDLVHILTFDPNFIANLSIQSESIQSNMRGLLDVGDVVEILTDNAEQAALTGRIGCSKKTTARDLGISKMRLKAAGRQEFREATTWVNSAVSPLSRQGDIREMMLRPQDRISLALQQAQLIQNSLQNKNNTLAQKEPALMAKLQFKIQNLITKLQMKANEAMLVNDFVPNYASIVPNTVPNTGQLFNILGSAVDHANRSHFFGPPAQAQDAYTGQTQSTGLAEKRVSRENIYDEK